jgi:hypothetical protein
VTESMEKIHLPLSHPVLKHAQDFLFRRNSLMLGTSVFITAATVYIVGKLCMDLVYLLAAKYDPDFDQSKLRKNKSAQKENAFSNNMVSFNRAASVLPRAQQPVQTSLTTSPKMSALPAFQMSGQGLSSPSLSFNQASVSQQTLGGF